MVKMKDAAIDPERDLTVEMPESVKSGLTIDQLEAGEDAPMPEALKALPPEAFERLQPTDFPGWQQPMLATPADKPFARVGWVYEQKLDGQRCIIFRKGGDVQFVSRNKLIITDQYPELVKALREQLKDNAVLDGEIVAFENGRPSFEQMQKRMHVQRPGKELVEQVPVFLYLFDVTYFKGYDTSKLTLLDRKTLLSKVVAYEDPLRFTEHREGDGVKYLNEACEKGLEGVIAKDANAPYQRRRSKSWLKFKCVRRQELVVGGYTEGGSGISGFGSLLVGYYGDDPQGRLQFAGGVGTGYSDELIRDITRKLKDLATDENPFAPDDVLPKSEVHWVKPQLVADVGFGEWTKTNKIRHPRFLGLRNDKNPRDVVREEVVVAEEKILEEAEWEPEEDESTEVRTASGGAIRTVDGHKIKLTNLDKVLFPDGITKGQIIDYYEDIAPYMLPHLKDRPLNLERFPSGIQEKGFYHKETPDYFPKFIDLVDVRLREGDDETQTQSMANNKATLVYLAQMAALTIHPWMSRAQHLEKPDKIVFDLDPQTDDSFDVVIEGARDLRTMLTEMGLPSFLMATGSRGLHIAVPIQPEHPYEAITLFSKAVCRKLERDDKKFTTQFRKEKRKGRVFLDHLRNRYGHTSVSPYTVRARVGAPVAAPLVWEELDDPGLRPNAVTILNVFDRLKSLGGDPWKDFFQFAAPLPDFDTIQRVVGL
jgi:bifunctional non-homologous end joining protein LigD